MVNVNVELWLGFGLGLWLYQLRITRSLRDSVLRVPLRVVQIFFQLILMMSR